MVDHRDIAQLLARIVAYDNRNVDELTITAWHEALADVALVDAVPAVVDHYKQSEKWIMPVHVRRLSAKHTQRRLIREAEGMARRELAGTLALEELEELVRLNAASWLQWREYKKNQALEA